MNFDKPFWVDGEVQVVIMNTSDKVSLDFALMGTVVPHKVALRLAGGCKGQDSDDKKAMMSNFSKVFDGYQGVLFGGGTRVQKDGKIDPMITDIPGMLAKENEGSIALGTAPRTDTLRLKENSRFILDEWGTGANPDMSGVLVVQGGPDEELGWDGDLEVYFNTMQKWKAKAGFTQVGLCSWNGGPVTEKEILKAAKLKWPVFLIGGSGRVTDDIINKLMTNDEKLLSQIPEDHNLIITSKEDPDHFRGLLQEWGFLE